MSEVHSTWRKHARSPSLRFAVAVPEVAPAAMGQITLAGAVQLACLKPKELHFQVRRTVFSCISKSLPTDFREHRTKRICCFVDYS